MELCLSTNLLLILEQRRLMELKATVCKKSGESELNGQIEI